MIDDRGCAVPQMLDRTHQRRQTDFVGAPAGRVRLIDPHEFAMVGAVANALEHIGWRVGVRVDEPRHQQPFPTIDDALSGDRRSAGRTNRYDPSGVNLDIDPLGRPASAGVHDEDIPDEQITSRRRGGHAGSPATKRSRPTCAATVRWCAAVT